MAVPDRVERTRVHVPAAEIFKETSKYFGILPRVSSFFSQAAIYLQIYFFLLFFTDYVTLERDF